METQVLIIGGGVVGTGLARDLALRGVHSILIEKRDINTGSSGTAQGILNCGARFIYTEPKMARECWGESTLLKRLAPECIEDTGGIYVAIEGDDEKYIDRFPYLCALYGIHIKNIDVPLLKDMEPNLTPKAIAAYEVKEGTINPYKISFSNLNQAENMGSIFLANTKVIDFHINQNRIMQVGTINTETGEEIEINAEQVVNASGPWIGDVAAMARIDLEVTLIKNTMMMTQTRLTQRVITRLRMPKSADMIVPSGVVSTIGRTAEKIDSHDQAVPKEKEKKYLVEEAAKLVPMLRESNFIRSYSGVYPVLSENNFIDDEHLSRGFYLLDHSQHGLKNFTTVAAGRLTTFRLMAEKTANLVCRRLGVISPCPTRTKPLPPLDMEDIDMPDKSNNYWQE